MRFLFYKKNFFNIMTYHLGIFLNNTNSEMKLKINLSNYNILRKNFTEIIIIDIENNFSQKLFDEIINPIIFKYVLNNKYSKNNVDDFDYEKIVDILKNIDYEKYDYISFINDNYIYLKDLKDYFIYINQHQLEFYSYTDSNEHQYHFQLYLFTIKKMAIHIFLNIDKLNDNLIFHIYKLFNKKMPFLKIAYLENNLKNNIFYNNNLYKDLLENDLLPIININKLNLLINDFKNHIHTTIPDDFDIIIYKNDDLSKYDNEKLMKHFINYGQFECRMYKNHHYILPIYIREKLLECNLLQYFDVPNDFNPISYRNKNNDLKDMNIKKLLLHWINYGFYEKRDY